jgi:hypothetical protein
MAEQDVTASLFYSGVWNNVDTDVFAAEQISVTRGQGSEGAALRPASVSLSLDNHTDNYRPTNPSGTLYGKAGRNTPLRVQVAGSDRAVVEATSWSPTQSIDFTAGPPVKGRSQVDVEAAGVLQRIGQWSQPLRSPFYRYNSELTNLVGYWPMEDTKDATAIAQTVTGARSDLLTGVEFAANDRFAGSDNLMTMSEVGEAAGYFAPVASQDAGWQFSFAMKANKLTVDATFHPNWIFMYWVLNDGTYFVFAAETLTQWSFKGYTWDGVNLFASTGSTGGIDLTDWQLYRFKCTRSGGTISIEWSYLPEGSTNYLGFTSTYAGTQTGSLKYWTMGGTDLSVRTYGHILGLTGTTDNLEAPRVDPFNGWAGETAADRFTRVFGTELGISTTVVGTAAESQTMGPQRVDKASDMLEEIATTEDGLIFDTRDEIGLTFRTRGSLYNQTAALALTRTDLSPPFQEILDDLNTHNSVTVKQRDGGSSQAVLTSGAMSTADPPSGVGEYKQDVNVNVYNEADLPLLAGWYLNRGTLERSRYAAVTVDLTKNPAITAAATAVDIGDYITVSGVELAAIPLLVIGTVEKIGTHSRTLTFTTVPADLFNPGLYDTARYDSGSTVTNTSYTSSATSIVFNTTNAGDVWSTVGVPYDVLIEGEQITVTAMGAVSGTGPYLQTATCTRHVNTVTKALSSGAEIHVATPGRYAR